MLTTEHTLAVTDLGAGSPALLMVPGWCGDRTVFDPIAGRTAAHHRTLTVDLPDHGESPAREEVTLDSLVDDLVAMLDASRVDRVVPVALSHAGWAAIELRRRLGDARVPGVVLLDWMVLGTPPGFAAALTGLQSPAWSDVREGLMTMWTDGHQIPALTDYVASMRRYGARHWQRAGREISASFAASPVPLEVLSALQPCPTLHLYAQPADDGFLEAQQSFAARHPWFRVRRLDASSHFPMFEDPEAVAAAIASFTAGLS